MKFVNMGLFDSKNEWIHPARKESTYEIIFNLGDEIYIEENNVQYSLSDNMMLILKPNVIHSGFKSSFGHTMFYWVHFYKDINDFDFPFFCKNFDSSYLFRELMHICLTPKQSSYLSDAILTHILALIRYNDSEKSISKLSKDIAEWTRINACATLTVEKIANHFSYNAEHISRLIKKDYGTGLKQMIDSYLISKSKSMLCNTEMTIKEIALICGFFDGNSFTNFFKYHEKIGPTGYRKKYTNIHMNNK